MVQSNKDINLWALPSLKTSGLFLTALVVLSCIAGCKEPALFFKGARCIEDISIIDPEKGLIAHQTIILKDGKILKVAPSETLELSRENQIVDGKGKFMIPGLWDAHVHFAYEEELAPRMFDLFLAYGITSVRDTGGRMDFVKKWKEKALADPTNAPRVMIAGPLLDGMPNVYDGGDPGHPPLSVGLTTVEEVTLKVNELDSLGVDLLKAYEMLSPEQFAKITQMGKEKGLKVTGHVPLSMDVISASNAGLNSMEHIRNLEFSCASNSDELLRERQEIIAMSTTEKGAALRTKIHELQRMKAVENFDENKANEVLKVLADNGTWQIPTLTLAKAYSTRYFANPDWQESFKSLPSSIERQWKSQIEEYMKTEVPESSRQYSKWFLNMVGKMHESKIEIMSGTDTPIFFFTPGRSLHKELELLVEVGLSPLEALKTATINPARYFNLEHELGGIKENMWADLVILNANPLENIDNTRLIHAVIKQGKYYDRSKLDQLLENNSK